MATQNKILYGYNQDDSDRVNTYIASDVQHTYINDLNNGNYSAGWLNFSNLNLSGSASDKMLDWAEAYITIPFEATISFDNANSKFAQNQLNQVALTLKNPQHLFDSCAIRYNGITVNHGNFGLNYVMNEKIKQLNNDQYRMLSDLVGFEFDSSDSYDLSNITTANNITTVLENNNKIAKYINPTSDQLNPFDGGAYLGTQQNSVNEGLIKRIKKFNNPVTTDANSNNIIYNSDSIFTDTVQSYCATDFSTSAQSTATFRYIVHYPLAFLSDFFKNFPSSGNCTGFELRLQLNISDNNYWGVTYDKTSKAIKALVQNQAVGRACPFMLAPKDQGMILQLDSTNDTTLTIKPRILWSSNNPHPTRIYVPIINFTPDYADEILSSPLQNILYTDYYIDTIQAKNGGVQITQLFSAQCSRPRTLYIIPFFSSTSSLSGVPPQQSLLSSAPTTCSACRINQVMIQIGGNNIFLEQQNYDQQFYNHQYLTHLAELNGNSIRSTFMSGQITKSDWAKCYNVYAFDMQKVADLQTDNQQKNFQLSFKVNTKNTVYYDFVVIMEYQMELVLNRISGQVVSGANV